MTRIEHYLSYFAVRYMQQNVRRDGPPILKFVIDHSNNPGEGEVLFLHDGILYQPYKEYSNLHCLFRLVYRPRSYKTFYTRLLLSADDLVPLSVWIRMSSFRLLLWICPTSMPSGDRRPTNLHSSYRSIGSCTLWKDFSQENPTEHDWTFVPCASSEETITSADWPLVLRDCGWRIFTQK